MSYEKRPSRGGTEPAKTGRIVKLLTADVRAIAYPARLSTADPDRDQERRSLPRDHSVRGVVLHSLHQLRAHHRWAADGVNGP